MRELRDSHGTPPLPNRDCSSRSLPEPVEVRRTSHPGIRTGIGEETMPSPRTAGALLVTALAAALITSGCSSSDSGTESNADGAVKQPPAAGGAAPEARSLAGTA